MRILGLICAASTALAGCGRSDEPSAPAATNSVDAAAAGRETAAGPAQGPANGAAWRWDLQSSGEGVALALLPASGPAAMRLFCPAGQKRLLVNLPSFRPVGSEERLSFGSGGEVVALVADTGGDRQRGGVSGTGAVPADLAALIGSPVSASYGAQSSGPHPAPPAALAEAFVAACGEGPATPGAAPKAASAGGSSGPCMTQQGKALSVAPIRAVGTEPFWNAQVEGRCVTYSHPEDQKGTRVWTRFTPGAGGGGTWSGNLNGRRFELRTRAQPGCSDGMSDRRYPLAAELVLGGERRSGCAEPI